MMGRFMKVKILERCNVSPSPPCVSPPPPQPGAVTNLPLTYLDIPWLFFPPSQPLFFYDYPHSTLDFLSSVLPLLKSSLALALRSFFPFAGTLKIGRGTPALACSDDFGISFIVAESTLPDSSGDVGDEFEDLVSSEYLPRNADRFQALVPSLLAPGDKDAVPLMAVQITAFSGCGFSVGIAYHHVAADERTFNNFLKSWTSLCKSFPGNPTLLVEGPCMDRTVIKDRPLLHQSFLNEWLIWKRNSSSPPIICTPLDVVVRSTFVVGPSDITLIKNQILAHCTLNNLPVPVHLSPYVLVCSFVWVNWVKAHLTRTNQPVPTRDTIYFGFIAGGITRLDYQVSDTYFGNCVGFGRGEAVCEEVVGSDGVVVAASAIAKAIKKLDKSMLEGAEGWIREWEVFSSSDNNKNKNKKNNDLNLMVSGSPKVEFYQTDFGWGKPKKIEQVSIDKTRGISLHESRQAGGGGMEVGLSLPTPIMDAFASLFLQALKDLLLLPSTN